ncbi:hypothetical protein MRX96_004474 [Rhipicephalus microplus]
MTREEKGILEVIMDGGSGANQGRMESATRLRRQQAQNSAGMAVERRTAQRMVCSAIGVLFYAGTERRGVGLCRECACVEGRARFKCAEFENSRRRLFPGIFLSRSLLQL